MQLREHIQLEQKNFVIYGITLNDRIASRGKNQVVITLGTPVRVPSVGSKNI